MVVWIARGVLVMNAVFFGLPLVFDYLGVLTGKNRRTESGFNQIFVAVCIGALVVLRGIG